MNDPIRFSQCLCQEIVKRLRGMTSFRFVPLQSHQGSFQRRGQVHLQYRTNLNMGKLYLLCSSLARRVSSSRCCSNLWG
jgi:hypothetical protein